MVDVVEASAAIAGLAGAWGLCLAVACAAQERMIFGRPRSVRPWVDGPHDGHITTPVTIEASDGVSLAGWVTAAPGGPRHVLVWFPGRNENIGWVRGVASWLGTDWAVCAFDYRGLGRSGGKAGERVCVEDGLQIVDWISRTANVPRERIVVVGRSLGSCVSMQVVAQRSVAGVCLIAPPASVSDLVKRNPLLKPAQRWLRHPFDSLAVAGRVRGPALVLMAERDRKVPHPHSHRLVEAMRRARNGKQQVDCRVVTIAGTNHCTVGRKEACLREISAFAREAVSASRRSRVSEDPGQEEAILSPRA